MNHYDVIAFAVGGGEENTNAKAHGWRNTSHPSQNREGLGTRTFVNEGWAPGFAY